MNKWLWMVVLSCAAATGAWAQQKGKAASEARKGSSSPAGVSWEGQVVKATGAGAPDMKAASPAQARLGAERAAQMDAFRNLLAQVKGIRVTAGQTVGEEMAARDEIRGKVEGVIRGFRVVDKRYYSDGGVEMDVELPLAAVAELVLPPPPEGEKAALNQTGDARNTGLVVDARGLKVTPALAPRLLDEKGAPLYGAEFLGDEARKSPGVAGYAKSLDEAKALQQRVGDKPLVLKAAKAKGADLVLGADAAKKLTEANNGYLAEGRVVIVTQ